MKVLGLFGKKQAGKDTVAKFLARNFSELFREYEYNGQGVQPITQALVMHWADPLKEWCRKTFNISRDLLWGDDAAKNTLTDLKWSSLPQYVELLRDNFVFPNSYMTVREVLQHWGTGVFRRADPDYWVKQLIEKIEALKGVGLVIIADSRFPNEASAIHKLGGRNVYLTRVVTGASLETHASENSMYRYHEAIDGIIDNHKLTIDESNKELVELLKKWSWV